MTGIILCCGGAGWLCCTIRYSKKKSRLDLETSVASKLQQALLWLTLIDHGLECEEMKDHKEAKILNPATEDPGGFYTS